MPIDWFDVLPGGEAEQMVTDERRRSIYRMRGFGFTFAQIGAQFQISTERARQLFCARERQLNAKNGRLPRLPMGREPALVHFDRKTRHRFPTELEQAKYLLVACKALWPNDRVATDSKLSRDWLFVESPAWQPPDATISIAS